MHWEIHRQAITYNQLESIRSAFDNSSSREVSENVTELLGQDVYRSIALAPIAEKLKLELERQSGLTGLTLEKVWFVKSLPRATDPEKLPYLPHFDKNRFLKAMVYLSPVERKNGAIRLGSFLDETAIEDRRRSLPSDYKDRGLNCIDRSELSEDLLSVEGAAGDVVFFDTNVPHAAGIVDEGNERRIVRFDFRHPSFGSVAGDFGFIRRVVSRLVRHRA